MDLSKFASAELPALKWGGIALLAAGLFGASFAAASDAEGPLRRAYERYVVSLERRLRLLFVFSTTGERIATIQLVAIGAVVLAAGTVGLEGWPLLVLVLAAGPVVWLERLRRKRVEAIEQQLDAFLVALSNALKATPSLGDAFVSVQRLLPPPLGEEIQLAVKEMRIGSTLEQAILLMASRIGSRQVDSALSSILIGRQIGGNLPKILDATAATLREMARLEGLVRSKTAEARAQLWVLALFPAGLVLAFSAFSEGYFDPLGDSATGITIIVVAVLLWVSSILVARKVLAVDV